VESRRQEDEGEHRKRHDRSLVIPKGSAGDRPLMVIPLMSGMAQRTARKSRTADARTESKTGAAAARAPRAIWSGTISFGLVSIPVRLYTATESHDVHFHLLHKRDGVRLKNVRWCPKDEKAVPWDEVVRGFEYAKGRYLPMTDDDLDHLPVRTVHTVDISDFVKLEEVDPIYYDKAYYLAPEETGAKAFVLLRQALEHTGRAAVAKVAIRDKESLCLVRPYQDVLSMETMFYANEIRPTKDIAVNGVGLSPKEVQMAVSLIENLSDRFDPERYHDEYQAALKKLIDARVEGAPLPGPPSKGAEKIVDLMEALRASVDATRKKPGGQADGRAPVTRSRAISSRRRKSA